MVVPFFSSSEKIVLARRGYKDEEVFFFTVSQLKANKRHNFVRDGPIQNRLTPSCSSRDGDSNGIQQITWAQNG